MNSIVDSDIDLILGDLQDVLAKLRGKRLLITGATGMVGQYLAKTVIAYAESLNEDERPFLILSMRNAAKAETVFGDLLQRPYVESIIKDVVKLTSSEVPNVDYILHAASSASPYFFETDPVGIIHANVRGTWNLLEIAQNADAILCFVSTMEVYGEIEPEGASGVAYAKESAYGAVDSLALRSAYPESKRMAENSCVAYAEQFGVQSVIARLTHTYGPGMSLSDGRIQADFMRKALNGEEIVLHSDGSSQRTYTYIADATSAILRVLLLGDTGAGAYNIANTQAEISIRNLAEVILLASGRSKSELGIEASGQNPMWNKATGRVVVNADKLTALGWAPRFSPQEGMARTAAFHREELSVWE